MELPIEQKVIIRPAKPEDKYIIVEIQYRALKTLVAKDYSYRQLNALLRSKSTPRKSPEIIFVAEINGQPVGFASLLHPFNTIGAIFVDPNYIRRNIGTLLIKRIELEAIANKIPVLWVYSSLTGYDFYRANGYQTIGKAFLPLYSTYIPCVRMKKRLLTVSQNEILSEIYQFVTAIIIAIALIPYLSKLIGFFFIK